MPRVPLADPDHLSPEQKAVYDRIVSGPRGQVVGPLRAVLLIPELAERWQQFGEQLRFNTSLPKRLTELAIITVARHYNSQVEWYIHARAALTAGVPTDVIAAIERGEGPAFEEPADAEVYDFARELLMGGDVRDETHRRICDRHGAEGVVELTAVIGYYAMVSMMLNAQDIPTPDGSEPLDRPWEEGGLPQFTPLAPGEEP